MNLLRVLTSLAFLLLASAAGAQELEPRRWNHLPVGSNFLGGGFAYTDGDLSFDPVLRIEDATVELRTFALKYIRTFEVLGRTTRVDLAGAYQDGTWEGRLDGVPTRVDRSGWADPAVRVAVNLYGAPPLEGQEFATYRAKLERETIVGAAVTVRLPLGEYMDDKLINLGANRFMIRPELGVVHNRGPWGFELTGASWFFTDNDDFFGGKELEQDPFLTIQGHVVYTFRPGMWLAAGVAYGAGQESTIDGEDKDDRKRNVVFGASAGYSFTRSFGVKIGYIGARKRSDTGLEFDSLVVTASYLW